MSRWRESSGASFGSTMVPPAESSSSKDWASWQKRSKSRSEASRRICALAHEGRAVDAREVHVVAAEVDAARGVARLHVVGRRRLGDLLEHEVRVEEDGVVLDALARAAEQLQGLRVHELDAELRDDPAPPLVEHGDRVLREDLVPGHAVHEHRGLLPRTLLDARKRPIVVSRCGRCHPRREQMSVASPPRGSRAIDRAAALLVAVVEADAPPALGELAEREALPRSTTARLPPRWSAGASCSAEADGRLRPGPVLVAYASPRGVRRRSRRARGARAAAAGRDLAARPSNLVVPRLDGAECVAQVDGRFLLGGRQLGRSHACRTTLGGGQAVPGLGRRARAGRAPGAPGAAHHHDPRRARARPRAGAQAGLGGVVDELEAGLAAVGAPVHAAGGRGGGGADAVGADRTARRRSTGRARRALVAREASDALRRLGAAIGKEVR